MPSANSYAVVGAGIVGALIAAKLAETGHRVTLYEKEPLGKSGACSVKAAAMLAPYSELDFAEPIIMQMGIRSLDLWPKIIQKYAPNTYFQMRGTLLVAHANERDELERFSRKVELHASSCISKLSSDDLYGLEPVLSDSFQYGLFIENEGQVDGQNFLRALQSALIKRGVKVIDNYPVKQVISHYIGSKGYDCVFDCRGLAAQNDLHDLRGVRGEILEIEAPEVKITRPIRLLHPRYPIYLVPRPNNRYLVGATLIESQSEKNVTIRSALELLSTIFSVHPGFAESTILSTKVGVRPAFKDNLPHIYKKQGLIHVNGLYRHGFLLAPIIAEALQHHSQAIEEGFLPLEELCSLQSTDLKHKLAKPVPSESLSLTTK